MLEATRKLLRLEYKTSLSRNIDGYNISDYFDVINSPEYRFEYNDNVFASNNSGKHGTTAQTVLVAKKDFPIYFDYSYSSGDNDLFTLKVGETTVETQAYGNTTTKSYSGILFKGQSILFKYEKSAAISSYEDKCMFYNMKIDPCFVPVDPVPPFISPYFLTKTSYVLNRSDKQDTSKTYYVYNSGAYEVYDKTEDGAFSEVYSSLYTEELVKNCPYTAKVERGKTYADVLLEYANILCAHIYYDVNGRLAMEPMTHEADDITDTNKEIVWHFTIEEKQLLGLNTTYNFDKVYNDIIILGNIVNGYQFKARVQNRNPVSDTCIGKIGLKSKDPLEDNQYYSDDQCKELAMYHAKVDTILQKSGDISSTPLYHLDVNKLVTVSTPNNNMSKELFLITGYTLNSSNSMSINVTSINVLKDFSVVEADIYE